MRGGDDAMMRFEYLIVHHSAGIRSATMEDIEAIHTDPRKKPRPYSSIGYHWVIEEDGIRRMGREFPRTGAHCPPNEGKLGVCLPGDNTGVNGQPWTTDQEMGLWQLVHDLRNLMPWLTIARHSEFRQTECPGLSEHVWRSLMLQWGPPSPRGR